MLEDNKMSMFPYEMKNRLNGPFELTTYVAGAIVGCVAGWKFGAEAVEYANQLTEHVDVLSALVKNHPTVTKVLGLAAGAEVVGSVTRLGGVALDMLVGTYRR